ncbi:hypothetical protein DC429_01140 [Arthrobacter sp. TPD3018]|uniref:DUF1176 domain-containing protein n=1 Tax=Bacteria TaxID=2 RepID=UPI000D51F5D6|nr:MULTISPECIES: DUF1176 domain-containing protein [Bacteria]PVE59049.1 hypothetical protein DC425_01140 [Sphingomonas sp. TPD3009]PVE60572.1 hypothetical protein DC429_01140 [Arthrobacter sp. TPD3018]PVE87248.1 hypothetical protein DC431_01135 [Sphingomonas melonis]
MTRHVALAALMLAACSSQPQADAAPTRTAEAAPRTAASPPATAKTRAPVTPKPGTLKTFGDWQVGCDNGLVCTMASLLPDDGAGAGATLNLIRAPGPQGRYHTVSGEGATDASGHTPAARFTVDGRDLGSDANALAAAMANGRVLKVPGGAISLKGASAALRYIDAMQGRAGTVTATVAQGAKPAASVPPAPALPIVTAQRLTRYTAKLPTSVVAAMKRIGRCDLSEGMESPPSVARTPDGRLLVIQPCSAGAYNVIGALFVVRGSDVRPAQVDASAGFDATGADSQTPVPSVVNGDFDRNVLTSYAKGRGLGDCGLGQTFAWDGSRYRLVSQDEMSECRGNTEYIATWRATMRR